MVHGAGYNIKIALETTAWSGGKLKFKVSATNVTNFYMPEDPLSTSNICLKNTLKIPFKIGRHVAAAGHTENWGTNPVKGWNPPQWVS